jgi:predicted nucleic acid-binding protein
LTIEEAVVLDPGRPKLGPGEAAAISLAKLLSARFILLDERKARRTALEHGLAVVGTLAVLLRAKDQGLIPALKPHLTAMEAQGRHFGEALIAQVLQAAGEYE